MQIRKFTDGRGVEWRAWRAAPAPVPREAGAYFAPERCPGGALCFESPFERRYVLGYPEDWEQRSDAELELLCGQAQVVPIRRADEGTGEFMRRQDDQFDATLRRRTFATPDNRVWMVEEYPASTSTDAPPSGKESGPPAVRRILRFRSGDAVRELDDYPADWDRYSPGKLVDLALRAKVVPAAGSPGERIQESPKDAGS